jgi:Mn-dependent DtxR family transcriptional regulator
MTKTSEKIMELFRKHDKVKAGMVLTSSELSFSSSTWEPSDFAGMDEAFKELSKEGYVIITPSRGLELTEKGLNLLFNEP